MHACLRSCGKEGGIFRGDAKEFVCLSPRLMIKYALAEFSEHLSNVNTKALTESVVLGTAMKVQKGALKSTECGVYLQPINGPGNELEAWVRDYLQSVAGEADASGGRTVAVVLDRDGEELLPMSLGADGVSTVSAQMQHSHVPITDVIVVLGGPSGIESDVMSMIDRQLLTVLQPQGVARVRLPGGLQHSNVALADFFMQHSRGALLPSLDLLTRWGADGYRRWRSAVERMLFGLLCPNISEADAIAKIESLAAISNAPTGKGAYRPPAARAAAVAAAMAAGGGGPAKLAPWAKGAAKGTSPQTPPQTPPQGKKTPPSSPVMAPAAVEASTPPAVARSPAVSTAPAPQPSPPSPPSPNTVAAAPAAEADAAAGSWAQRAAGPEAGRRQGGGNGRRSQDSSRAANGAEEGVTAGPKAARGGRGSKNAAKKNNGTSPPTSRRGSFSSTTSSATSSASSSAGPATATTGGASATNARRRRWADMQEDDLEGADWGGCLEDHRSLHSEKERGQQLAEQPEEAPGRPSPPAADGGKAADKALGDKSGAELGAGRSAGPAADGAKAADKSLGDKSGAEVGAGRPAAPTMMDGVKAADKPLGNKSGAEVGAGAETAAKDLKAEASGKPAAPTASAPGEAQQGEGKPAWGGAAEAVSVKPIAVVPVAADLGLDESSFPALGVVGTASKKKPLRRGSKR